MGKLVLETKDVSLFYGKFKAVSSANLPVHERKVTAMIGPSGCGKSTFLRTFNRMNDYIDGFRVEGHIHFNGKDIFAPDMEPEILRQKIGMVFQKPNPFPSSIAKNISWGPKIHGFKGDTGPLVRNCLERVGLWEEVKDKLNDSGLALSGGQQQRLCIARAIAMEPEVILMDEPCSALDPKSTLKIEELIHQLKEMFSIIIVTHNMQQAARVSDYTAFLYQGEMVEFAETKKVFEDPDKDLTKDYIAGAFG